jgi:hypothetical protein
MATNSRRFHIFLSHSRLNVNDVEKLYNELKKKNYNIWFDRNEMISGNVDNLMKNGIDNSELFMCCATTNYCSSDNCFLEFNYAIFTGKKIIYILFEKFNGNKDMLKKLDKISFRFAGEKYYKHDDLDGIVKVIEKLRQVFSFKMRILFIELLKLSRMTENKLINYLFLAIQMK